MLAKQELERESEEKKKPDDRVRVNQNAKQVKDENCGASVCFMAGVDQQKCWYIDSGASRHMTNDRNFFKSLKEENGPSVVLANGKVVTAAGCGEGFVYGVNGNGSRVEVKLTNVLYVPSLASGLVSVDRLTAKEFSVRFKKDGCDICDASGKKVVIGEKSGSLYRLKLAKVEKKVEGQQPIIGEKKTTKLRSSPVSVVSWYSEMEPNRT